MTNNDECLAAGMDPANPETCPKCGQSDTGQTGEYPCVQCGLPTTHDALAQQLAARQKTVGQQHDDLNRYAHELADSKATITRLESQLADAVGLLRRIASGPSCGCKPCTGDCTSKLSLEIILDEIRDEARAFLSPAEDKANDQ
jgi:hypothetical protein